MEREDLKEILETTAVEAPSLEPNDTVPPDRETVIENGLEVNLDEDKLGQYCVESLKNSSLDKDESGFGEQLLYDYRAYHQIKNEYLANWPHPNASNYPVPITPIQVDVGQAVIEDLLFRDSDKVVVVKGIGPEDKKNAANLAAVMNGHLISKTKGLHFETSSTVHQMLKHGTSHLKILRTFGDRFSIRPVTIPIERCFMPVDQKSPAIGDSENWIHVIPLNENDMRERAYSKLYKNMQNIPKGFYSPGAVTSEKLLQLQKRDKGLALTDKMSRDTWFIAEGYFTYYPPLSSRKRELIVWFVPATGQVLRVIRNIENIRPVADWYIYPNYGNAFHTSLPKKIKHIQEKADYTDKQVTDATDKNINPAGFYEGNSGFDPSMSLRVPTGMYPVKNLGTIQWEQPSNMGAILERQRYVDELFLQADRVTGFTDIYQGIISRGSKTLGQDIQREKFTAIRFAKTKNHINAAWGRTCNIFYNLMDRYMPKQDAIDILGSQEFPTIEKIFPNIESKGDTGLGLGGEFDFAIANKTIYEEKEEKESRAVFSGMILAHPIFGRDEGNAYRAMEMRAGSMDIRDFATIVKRPPSANTPTPDEIIEKIMSREPDVLPDFYADTLPYELKIKLFMRTGNFLNAPREVQFEFIKFMKIIDAIKFGREQAARDFSIKNKVEELAASQVVGQQQAQAVPSGQKLPQEVSA